MMVVVVSSGMVQSVRALRFPRSPSNTSLGKREESISIFVRSDQAASACVACHCHVSLPASSRVSMVITGGSGIV